MNPTAYRSTVRTNGADVRAALNRIVESPGFRKSPQLAHFLTFVVEETLAGRAQRIKAYNIAADALGRDASFDPQHDPIVRVEAGRLRRALDHYYADGGAGDPLIIDLPRGHYVPAFRPNSARRRAEARLRALWSHLTDAVRTSYRMVLMIVIIAVTVSVGLDALAMLVRRAIRP